jgi:hypothetical protein
MADHVGLGDFPDFPGGVPPAFAFDPSREKRILGGRALYKGADQTEIGIFSKSGNEFGNDRGIVYFHVVVKEQDETAGSIGCGESYIPGMSIRAFVLGKDNLEVGEILPLEAANELLDIASTVAVECGDYDADIWMRSMGVH